MDYLVLFDIDGTLLQMRKGQSVKLFTIMIEEIFDRDISELEIPSFAGKTDLQILKEIAELSEIPFESLDMSIERIWERSLELFREYCTVEHIDLMPGIRELIPELDKRENIQLGLLTGNFKGNAYMKLKVFGMDKYFPFGAFGSDNENRDLLPPIAISRANEFRGDELFSKDNTLIIGDSPLDVQCGKASDIPVISVATGLFSKEELEDNDPDVVFEDFRDTGKTIDKIFEILEKRK